MRNAVEHPGERSGILYIHNFELHKIPKKEEIVITEPSWHIDDGKRTSILKDMDAFLKNLLEFTEDLLVICIKKTDPPFPIVIEEIPEADRDPTCPIRFRATISLN